MDENDIKVSIIVPVYMAESYLPQCIQSLINQTYKNIEIILIDDGSTDNSGRICDYYAASDKRIKVIHKENSGVGSARNDGIREATGEYLYFVDADDYVDNTLIAESIELAKKNYFDILIFGFKKINKRGKIISQKIPKKITINSLQTNRNQLTKILASGTGLAVWDKLIKTSLIIDSKILFDNKKRGQDFSFVFNCYEKAQSVCSIDKSFYYYRVSIGNSVKFDNKIIENHFENFTHIKKYFEISASYGYDVRKFLDNLFVLWFFGVIPINITNLKIKSFKEKKKTLLKLTNSLEFLEWLRSIKLNNLTWKNKIIFIIGRAKKIYILYFMGILFGLLRKLYILRS